MNSEENVKNWPNSVETAASLTPVSKKRRLGLDMSTHTEETDDSDIDDTVTDFSDLDKDANQHTSPDISIYEIATKINKFLTAPMNFKDEIQKQFQENLTKCGLGSKKDEKHTKIVDKVLSKYNAKLSKGYGKDIKQCCCHLMSWDKENCNDVKQTAFWLKSKNSNFKPPETCPAHLSCLKHEALAFDAINDQIVSKQKKKSIELEKYMKLSEFVNFIKKSDGVNSSGVFNENHRTYLEAPKENKKYVAMNIMSEILD